MEHHLKLVRNQKLKQIVKMFTILVVREIII